MGELGARAKAGALSIVRHRVKGNHTYDSKADVMPSKIRASYQQAYQDNM